MNTFREVKMIPIDSLPWNRLRELAPGRRPSPTVIGVLCAVGAALFLGRGCAGPEPSEIEAASIASPEALQALLEETMVCALQRRDHEVAAFMQGTILPDHRSWFARVFDERYAPQQSANYDHLLEEVSASLRDPQGRAELREQFAQAFLRRGWPKLQVLRIEPGDDPERYHWLHEELPQWLGAMRLRVPLYVVWDAGRADRHGMLFVHEQGAFRFLNAIGGVEEPQTRPESSRIPARGPRDPRGTWFEPGYEGPAAPVRGRVTCDGAPVGGALVTFWAGDKAVCSERTDGAGRFETSAPPGCYAVTVSAGAAGSYRRPQTSPLRVLVADDGRGNRADFDLEPDRAAAGAFSG